MFDIDPRESTEEQMWLDEKAEMDTDEAYWNWLALVEQRLDEELGEDNAS